MGRRHLPAPSPPTHDVLTNAPLDAPEVPHPGYRSVYRTTPANPDGYADFAAGGRKHEPPPPLGAHERTDACAEIARLAGGRAAGASRHEMAPKDCAWMRQRSMTLQLDPALADPASPTGVAQPTEHAIRFPAPPPGFEPRSPVPRRHPSDASVRIAHANPGASSSRGVGRGVAAEAETYGAEPEPETTTEAPLGTESPPNRRRGHSVVRPLPPPTSRVHLGADGPAALRTAHSDHFPDRTAAARVRGGPGGLRGAGLPNTRDRAYHLVDGSDRKPASNPKDHYGAGRAHADPEGTGHPLAAFGKNRVPGVQPAPFDVITGAPRAIRARDVTGHGRGGGGGAGGERSSSGAGAGGSGGDSARVDVDARGAGAFPARGGGGMFRGEDARAPHPFEHPGAGRVDPRGLGAFAEAERRAARERPGGVGTRPRVGPESTRPW